MKIHQHLVLLLLLAGSAQAQSGEICPVLPSGTGLEWKYLQGPDFDVCYALDAQSKQEVFGLYLGYHPSFHPSHEHRAERGYVGKHKVTWYKQGTEGASSAYARETSIPIGEHGYQAHVWINASTPQELKQRRALLQQIRFQ